MSSFKMSISNEYTIYIYIYILTIWQLKLWMNYIFELLFSWFIKWATQEGLVQEAVSRGMTAETEAMGWNSMMKNAFWFTWFLHIHHILKQVFLPLFRQTLLGRRFASLKHVTRARPDDCLRRFPVCGINKPRDLAEFRCRIRYRLGRNSGFTFRRPTFALHGRLQACKHATIGKSVICNGAARWKWKQWCSRFLIQLYEWYESSPTYTT